MSGLQQWAAPEASAPITATVAIPGSKSETNRALILAALASGPSVITAGLEARDTQLMRDALRALGVEILEKDDRWEVNPPESFVAGGTIDCGLAGTVMRFVPPIAALAHGTVRFDGDEQAYARPMAPLLGALKHLGARIDGSGHSLPFNLTGSPQLRGGSATVDAAESSQFLSGLLLAGARYAHGLDVHHIGGEIPSRPHIQMTLAMLRARGVDIDDTAHNRWVVSPGAIQPLDVTIEPDLRMRHLFSPRQRLPAAWSPCRIGRAQPSSLAMRSARSWSISAQGSRSRTELLRYKAPTTSMESISI